LNADVTAAQLSLTTFQSGSGSDLLWVRAFDGTLWSNWASFTVSAPIDTGPVVNSVSNIQTTAGQTFAASSLFTASDPFALARGDLIFLAVFGAACAMATIGGMQRFP
jgi:hypothetical protein